MHGALPRAFTSSTLCHGILLEKILYIHSIYIFIMHLLRFNFQEDGGGPDGRHSGGGKLQGRPVLGVREAMDGARASLHLR